MARTKAQIIAAKAAVVGPSTSMPCDDKHESEHEQPQPKAETYPVKQPNQPSEITDTSIGSSRSKKPRYKGDLPFLDSCFVYIDNTNMDLNKTRGKNTDGVGDKNQGDVDENRGDTLNRMRLLKLRADIEALRTNNAPRSGDGDASKSSDKPAGGMDTEGIDVVPSTAPQKDNEQTLVAVVENKQNGAVDTKSGVDSEDPDNSMDVDSGVGGEHMETDDALSSSQNANELCTSAEILTLQEESSDAVDTIWANLPSARELCSPSFEFAHIDANPYEPAHTITAPRTTDPRNQSTFEFRERDFFPPVNPASFFDAQRRKFEHWAKLDPDCESVTVNLIRQHSNCRTFKANQPQCRGCIRRTFGDRCRFADIRLIIQVRILLSGAEEETTRFILCPMLYSRLSKLPSIRHKTMPIYLPGRLVAPGDDSWTEFHILCQTVSTIKSLLRVELTIVRDTLVSTLKGSHSGAITFNYEVDGAGYGSFDNAAGTTIAPETPHPLYSCSSLPCILRTTPQSGHQKCEKCNAPIFSAYFACCLCMSEVCERCFVEWDDSDVKNCYHLASKADGEGASTSNQQAGDKRSELSYCKRLHLVDNGNQVRHETRHRKIQFVRVSNFSQDELEMMLRKANKMVGYCDHLDKNLPSGYSTISLCSNELGLRDPGQEIDYSWIYERLDAIDEDSEVIVNLGDADFTGGPHVQPAEDKWQQPNESRGAGPSRSISRYLESMWDQKLNRLRHECRQPLEAWNRQPIYVTRGELSLREFARAWEENNVVVATGLLDERDLDPWNPNVLLTTINLLFADVFEIGSKTRSSSSWPVDQFLQLFTENCAYLTASNRKEWTELHDAILSARRRAIVKPDKEDVRRLEQTPGDEDDKEPGAQKASGTRGRGRGRPRGTGRGATRGVARGAARGGRTGRSSSINDANQEKPTSTNSAKADKEPQDRAEASIFLKQKLDEVIQKLPFPQYTSRDGTLNLVNRLPGLYARPSLDPELQLAYGTCDVGSRDNLRCEVSDMVNVLVFASSKQDMDGLRLKDVKPVNLPRGRPKKGKKVNTKSGEEPNEESADEQDEAAVRWDIFPFDARETIGEFDGGDADSNAVYEQRLFLDTDDLRDMYEAYGDDARCFRVYQRVGDAVFIPAGCAYQRSTLRNTVAVQSRFLSPEHANIAHEMSGVFSKKKYAYRRKDILPVMDILWWIWMGNSGGLDSFTAAFTAQPSNKGVKRAKPSSERPAKRSKAETVPRSRKAAGKAKPEPEPESEPESEAEYESGAGFASEPEPESEPKPKSRAKPRAKAQTKPKSKAKPKAKAATNIRTRAKTKS
ncbi:hypothetical protein LPJ57_000789 [Coemansia sp. RSA 486]|nr:hypothetical protein LPJ57_000789 [Coemansia sp. RSA 486]KAJ2235595.1 hypothetical protein IWW45_002471 [Coemansia sp. RSA 485]KAJ2600601.1 hypothetical protein GGF39_001680 [Coemansia sp. RSA 1721]KAJ2640325.1 hypothetical protein GGF40_000224 [Coemansia sp. RSA 1286]